ncbi:MAG TPA: AzlC family ABC transporter permease [Burkholderiaceae bacterium]|nr:AzlC family ABC transporter permease [Burkholderiaceae bacterium]
MSESSAATTALWRHAEFRRGAREMAGVALGISAWGVVAGVAMANSSLGTWWAVVMSLVVFSGTGQIASLPLLASGAPLWVVWATVLCVNLRFVIFSLQWRPYWVHLPLRWRFTVAYFSADLNYFTLVRRFPDPTPCPEQWPYFWGGMAVNWGSWQLSSLLGIALAHHLPMQWGLSFAGTTALLALTYTMVSDRATWLAAAVAACAAVAAFALPLRLNILVAIAAAVTVGVVLDHLAPKPPRKAIKEAA